jgi:hypothetical protein
MKLGVRGDCLPRFLRIEKNNGYSNTLDSSNGDTSPRARGMEPSHA